MAQEPHIFIATHHKGGTVWMNSTFRRVGLLNGFSFVHLNTGEPAWTTRPDKREYMLAEMARVEAEGHGRGVFVDYHATTPDLSGIDRARGLHMVRDPRDMLISAIHYHERSDESWLDQPRQKWGGKTFRQKLLSYDDRIDRFRFELDTYMGEEIRRMAAFADRPDCPGVFRTVRYEDLIVDEQMVLFHELCLHLGLGGLDLVRALRAFWEMSIFGGMREARESGRHKYIRHGGVAQWRETLSAGELELIQGRVGDAIERLGYDLA